MCNHDPSLISLLFSCPTIRPMLRKRGKTNNRSQCTGGEMRLTCPNCEAQYEVPDEVIPANGRDVQCSNCGDTWFEHHPDHVPEKETADEADQSWDATPPAAPAREPEDAEIIPDESESEEATASDPMPERRELDPAVKDVLREEADRERAARDHDSGLETQPDLGLDAHDDEIEKRSRESQARMARLRGEPDGAEAAVDPSLDPGTRRNLLPDIDEINSSLSSDNPNSPGAVDPGEIETPVPAKGGFRRGFLMMVLLAVIGLLLYMFAPQLAETIPALGGILNGFVDMINGTRAWLDSTVGGLMGTLDGMSSEGN